MRPFELTMRFTRKRAATTAILVVLGTAPPLRADDGWNGPAPWRAAGLSERRAAAFLLERWTFGPRPGEVDRVLEVGLRNWIEGQLVGDLPGSVAQGALARLPAVSLSHDQILRRYLQPVYVLQEAMVSGAVTREDYSGKNGQDRRHAAQQELDRYTQANGFRPPYELLDQLGAQKLYRAVYSESQLVEVLTDFWFNHFNVATSSPRSAAHILSYERDAIRPHVLGSFRELLGASARHPAMLLYLDNASSVAPREARTSFDRAMEIGFDSFSPMSNPSYRDRLAKALGWRDARFRPLRPDDRGLNENYARELLELHTLGVDGGYTQSDVVEVARAFTGWTTFPPAAAGKRLRELLADAEAAADLGFTVEGEFLFRPDRHDSDEKLVLGAVFPAGRGIEDGEEVLDRLVRHPSTARHLASKLAVRFVADRPPPALVERLVKTYDLTGGDLREMMRTLLVSPEFWKARAAKVKSPFELAVSALRALDAEVADAGGVLDWIGRMGQPLYGYAAPTGYPDRADSWTGVGSMLARFNFAFELANGNIRGVTFDLLDLVARRGDRRGEERGAGLASPEDAVAAYFPLLLPERSPRSTLPWVGDGQRSPAKRAGSSDELRGRPAPPKDPRLLEKLARKHAAYAVGVLLASPEFQLR